ncbi:MAG: D-glucuronyl C5-epimerase family protein [Myxococcota bacterium]
MLLDFALFSNILIAEDIDKQKLYLSKFYAQNPYNYLISYYSEKEKASSCNAEIKPFFGIKTKKEFVESPTKAAADGLTAVINGDISLAKSCADYLIKNNYTKGDAILFPFKFDFIPYMPYRLKSPWISAISQGLSLGLFTYLYLYTNDSKYLKIANRIFNSYKIPIEEGGFTRFYSDSVFFEQYPAKDFIGVFNGSAVAALALWDYYVITKKEDVLLLFKKYIKWLEENVHKYEKLDEKYKIPITYYSLAIKRPELLFRFYGDGLVFIKEIKYYGIKDNNKKLVYTLKIGSRGDDNPENNIYLFANQEYSNWSPPHKGGRYINQKRGIYNHSPFYINLSSDYSEYEIGIQYIRISYGDVSLQLYDGKEYFDIAPIKGELNKLEADNFTISKEMVDRGRGNIKNEPIIEYKYLDDNYILLTYLAEISKSEILKKYSLRWRDSTDLVDAEWYNQFPPEMLYYPKKILEINNLCRKGIEDISLIKNDNTYYLLYNCKIEPNENRLSLASGRDIYNLKDNGWLLANNFINENDIGSASNPYLLENKGLFSIFFISNDMIYSLITDNIWKWNTINEVYQSPTGKFTIFKNGEGFQIYSIGGKDKNKIILTEFSNFIEKAIVEEPSYKSFTDLNIFMFNEYRMLLVRVKLPARIDSYLYTDCKGDLFVNALSKPFMIEKPFIKTPYTKKRDYFVFTEGDKIYLLFTGYNLDNEFPDGIYISEIKRNILEEIIKKSCKK